MTEGLLRRIVACFYKAMQKIIVASKNPVKIKAVARGFRKMFPGEEFAIEGISVASGVREQPMDGAETLTGALNRANNAAHEEPDRDYWVGIEGGIELKDDEMMEAFAWVVIRSKDGAVGKGKTGTFFLPPKVAELIKAGKELGKADDIVFGRSNSKQENGAVGILTDNAIDRTSFYTEAVVLALIPLKNSALYRRT
jgi:inosine/xanthosine triphosphatase